MGANPCHPPCSGKSSEAGAWSPTTNTSRNDRAKLRGSEDPGDNDKSPIGYDEVDGNAVNLPSTFFDPLRLFELHLAIAPADIDDLGHVNNVVYLRWVQEVASAHWQSAAAPEDHARLAWVVTRHELDYKAAAFLGDEIVGRTRIGATTPITCERFVEIRRTKDDKLLVASRSVWVPVDRTTGRPKRIEDSVLAPFRST
jgi:acyl-CoA thioester hydrolase